MTASEGLLEKDNSPEQKEGRPAGATMQALVYHGPG